MARQKTGNVRVNVYLDPKVLQAAKVLASRRGTSYSEIIRSAAREYVVKELQAEKAQAQQPASA